MSDGNYYDPKPDLFWRNRYDAAVKLSYEVEADLGRVKKRIAELETELAAAEERGRRAGVEEATARLAVWDDHLRVVGSVHACEQLLEAAKAAYEHLDSFGVVAGGTPREHESQRRAFDMLRPFVTRALAPRDSAPALVVCDHCPEFPHPLNDDGTACKHPRAPRDSGKVAMVKEFTREEAVAMFGPRKDRP